MASYSKIENFTIYRKNSLERRGSPAVASPRQPKRAAAAKKPAKPAVVDTESEDDIIEDSESEEDMFAATPPPSKAAKNGKLSYWAGR